MSNAAYITTGFYGEARARRERQAPVYSFGIPGLDKSIGGGLYDGLHILGGSPVKR